MRYLLAFLAPLLALAAMAEAPTRTIYNDEDYTPMMGLPVSIVVPANFLPSGDGKTFRHKAINAAIEITRLEAPYADVIKVFTAEEMSARGLRLLSKDNVTTNNRAALLLHVSENTTGAAISRWTLVIGDYQETCMVNGTYPNEAETQLSAILRGAVMSTRWTKRDESDPFANFRFTITPSPKLTFSKELNALLVFTGDGNFPLSGPGDPLLIAGYELNEEKITNERTFAADKLKKVPHCKDITPTETTSISLGGLQGFESTADAKDESSGVPIKVYQLLLFADGYHVFILGIVDVPRAPEYLADFKAMARTFKMK